MIGLKKAFDTISSVVSSINQKMFTFALIIICVTVILMTYDILARSIYFLPMTKFGYDMLSWFVAVVMYLTAGHAILEDNNIRVDLFYDKYSVRTKAFVEIFSGILMMLLAIVLIWFGSNHVLTLMGRGTIANTGFNIPLWAKWVVLPIGGLLIALQAMIQLVDNIYFVITGKGKRLEGKGSGLTL